MWIPIRLQPHSTPDICPHLRWLGDQSSNRACLQSQLGQLCQARRFRSTSRNNCRSGRPLGGQPCRGCMPHSCSTMKAGGLAPASSGTPGPGIWWRASRPVQHHGRRRRDHTPSLVAPTSESVLTPGVWGQSFVVRQRQRGRGQHSARGSPPWLSAFPLPDHGAGRCHADDGFVVRSR